MASNMDRSGPRDYDYDVFLAHCTDDRESVLLVQKVLRDQGLIPYAYYEAEGSAGKPIYWCSVEKIKTSKVTLACITANTMRSHWTKFEIIMAMEESTRRREFCLKLLFIGMGEAESEQVLRELKCIPAECCTSVDMTRNGWEHGLGQKIMEKCRFDDVHRLGNIGHGLVYSYFTGYLAKMLTDDGTKKSDRIEESDLYKKYSHQMSTRFHILLPESCKTTSLKSSGPIEKIDVWKRNIYHAGKPRTYDISVYRVKHNGKEYIFTGEIPAAITLLARLDQLNCEDVSVDRTFQLTRFHKTLFELIHHQNNGIPRDSATVLWYDDTNTNISEVLAKSIETELEARQQRQGQGALEQLQTDAMPDPAGAVPDGGSNQVLLLLHDNDTGLAARVTTHLEAAHISTVVQTPGTNRRWLGGFRWSVVFLTRSSVNDTGFLPMVNDLFTQSVDNNRVEMLGLYFGIAITDIPEHLRCAVVLNGQDDGQLAVLERTIKGGTTRLMLNLSAGDVATGFAWGYVVNYLQIQCLGRTKRDRDFHQRFDDASNRFGNGNGSTCVKKMLGLFPRDCESRAQLASDPPSFQRERYLGQLEEVEVDGRKFNLHMFEFILSTGQRVRYCREYSTPSMTLREMQRNFAFAGLTPDSMVEQQCQLARKITEIISREEVKQTFVDIQSKFEAVYYDVNREDESDVLERVLSRLVREL